uniref:Uncharacterized protein n=1 Tax=Romanomermis culicivorax TaxID=13658 RepID=A0A915HTJ2_ROMCU
MATENFYQMLINVMNLWGEVLHEFGEQGRRNFADPAEEQALFQYRSALIRLVHEFPGDHKKVGRARDSTLGQVLSGGGKITISPLPGDDFQGFLDKYEIHMRKLTDKIRTIARNIVLTILCTTDALLAFHYKNKPEQNVIKHVERIRLLYSTLLERLDAIDYIVREREDQVHNLTKKFILIYGHSMQARDQGMLIRPSKASYYPSNLLLDAAALLPNYMPTVIDGRVGQLQVLPSYVVKNRQNRLHADIETTLLLTLAHAWYNHVVGFIESCDMLFTNQNTYEE